MSRLLSIALIILPVLLCGCGDGRPELVETSGQVLLNGEPLTFQGSGFIQVIPADNRSASGKINPQDGTFKLTTFENGDGVIPGEHPVTVKVTALGPGGQAVDLLPREYTDIQTSGLTIVVDQPTDSLKIELEGKLRAAPSASNALQGDASGF
ncbi:hypothetical protein ACYFX5_08565 [Bremerella sp. T1]|uniref:hypothetical protein n=1 Tax=Bremerella sp. TYQ1 TaxID=3119568 RepID=UPI001CCB9876|nr:hypothetical protein [Bremerella volcania]UBM38308.1 hypothetical protein LA756_10490 [Bremerella volcania]